MFYAGLVFLSMTAGIFVQQEPRVLLQHLPFETLLYETYPELANPEPTVYVFSELREVRPPRQAERWFEEMKTCLISEGQKIREYLPIDEVKFYEFTMSWGLKNHRGVELRGVWFVESIAYHDVLTVSMKEQTIRHEMIHHLIGLTHHPLTPRVVGQCMPALMLDERKDKDAGSARTGGALPPRFWRLRNERMGPVPFGRDGVVGVPRIQVGPLRGARGTGLLPSVRTP